MQKLVYEMLHFGLGAVEALAIEALVSVLLKSNTIRYLPSCKSPVV